MKIYNYRRMLKYKDFLDQAESGYLKQVTEDFVEDLIKSWNDEFPKALVTRRTFNCGSCLLDKARRFYIEMKDYELKLKTK